MHKMVPSSGVRMVALLVGMLAYPWSSGLKWRLLPYVLAAKASLLLAMHLALR